MALPMDFETMTSPDSHSPEKSHLPEPAADLVVALYPGARWRLLSISPSLAEKVGLESVKARNIPLEQVFAGATPSLVDLAGEALSRDQVLREIPVRLPGPGVPTLLAEVRPGGLTEDYQGRVAAFFFRQPHPAKAGAATERGGLVGNGPAMAEVYRKIGIYAAADAAVVITGETGTGKELVARAIHDRSPRAGDPFVAVNCAAISEELLESELFGHEKGAFTGALRSHRGRFERADGGTLFLDEIGEMPLHTQAKLLRVLEEGSIERVGGERSLRVDVRVVCATNVFLEQAVGEGRFRPDLYHRLSVLRIHLPPLRQRLEDIPELVGHFLAQFGLKYGRRVQGLTPEALQLLQAYLWPGNVRELRNVLERVFVESAGEVIGARAFREWVRERQDFSPGEWNLITLDERPRRPLVPPYPLESDRRLLSHRPQGILEAELLPGGGQKGARRTTRPVELDPGAIRRAYRAAGGNLTAAARLLGVHRATLYRHLRKLGLEREDLEGQDGAH